MCVFIKKERTREERKILYEHDQTKKNGEDYIGAYSPQMFDIIFFSVKVSSSSIKLSLSVQQREVNSIYSGLADCVLRSM